MSFGLYDTIYPQTYSGWSNLAQNQLPYQYQTMTPYATPAAPSAAGGGGGSSLGGSSLGSSWPSFTYPTSQEAYNSVYGLPHMQAQAGILGQLGDMGAFRSAVLPEIQGVMRGLGRSGLPSSSYADRTITDTMGSLYNKWLWNALTGWQNFGAQMPSMMGQWYQPYDTMLRLLAS